jgi:ribonuclease VapC
MSAVLDASAVLAVLRQEPGRERVMKAIDNALISSVNLHEVYKELALEGIEAASAFALVDMLELTVRPHGETEALEAAMLTPLTNKVGCGLGDRCCIALAIAEGLPALTSDRPWQRLDIPGLIVELIR